MEKPVNHSSEPLSIKKVFVVAAVLSFLYACNESAGNVSSDIAVGIRIGNSAPSNAAFVADNLVGSRHVVFVSSTARCIYCEQLSNQEDVLPRLGRKEIMNIKGVNYEELIPVIIKAMQEQDAKIDALTQLVEKLQSSSTNSGSGSKVAVNTVRPRGASLDQNIPGPLTNSTSIRHNIPAGSTEAQFTITDNDNDTVKQILLNGSGKRCYKY